MNGKNICLGLIVSLLFLSAKSQSNKSALDSIKIDDRFKLNFVVPDMPSFRALNIEPSNALRPSDVKDFAVMLAPFYNNGKVGIPKNFALEFAPWKMASGNWTIADYSDEKKGWLKRLGYNSGFSVGAVEDTTRFPSKLSIGYRLSLLTKNADPLRSDYINSQLDAFEQSGVFDILDRLRSFWMLKVGKILPSDMQKPENQKRFEDFMADMEAAIPDSLKNDNEWLSLQQDLKRLFGEDYDFKGFSNTAIQDFYNRKINEMMEEYRKLYWNASRFDFALAWVGESTDTKFGNTRFSSLNMWATYAARLKEKGQLLIGGSIRLPNNAFKNEIDGDRPIDFTGNLRLLVGNQKFRFFGETQWRYLNYGDAKNSILLNLGTEVKFSDRFWLVAFGGVENLQDRSSGNWFDRLVSSLDLRYGFN